MSAYLSLTNGPDEGATFSLKGQGPWVIGNDPDEVDFLIHDSSIGRTQLLIEKREETFFIKNLQLDVLCEKNEEPILQDFVEIIDLDHVSIGNTQAKFHLEIKNKKDTNSAAFDAIFADDETAKELPEIGSNLPSDEPEAVDPLEEDESEKTAYDTIFEDQDSDIEALPFNLMNDAPLILKVIAGPNAGAEIGLEKNRQYIIGKDPHTSDIVFQDLSVSRNHAKLSINENGSMEIEDLGSKNKTLVNGASLESPKTITGQDIISTGTTTFLIIDREADIQTIYAPEYSSLESIPSDPEEKELPLEEKEPISWKNETIPSKYWVFAGSFAVIVFAMFVSIFSIFTSKTPDHIAKTTEEQEIKKIFSNYHDLTFNYSPRSGKIFVVGHVLTPVRKQTLLYQLQDLPFINSLEENIIIDEVVAKSINDVLVENMGLKGITVHSPKEGLFVVSGYLQTAEEFAELSDYLQSNFLYAERLENHVIVENTLIEEIQNLILAKGFSGIKMQMTNGMLILGGMYDQKASSKYKDLLSSLKKLKGIRGLKNLAIAAGENSARIDLSQNYQVSGFAEYDHMNYSVVINGQIVTMGETINGMKITKILPEMVLLEKNGLKYKINYSR